jgi:hypothetical protein
LFVFISFSKKKKEDEDKQAAETEAKKLASDPKARFGFLRSSKVLRLLTFCSAFSSRQLKKEQEEQMIKETELELAAELIGNSNGMGLGGGSGKDHRIDLNTFEFKTEKDFVNFGNEIAKKLVTAAGTKVENLFIPFLLLSLSLLCLSSVPKASW